MNLQTAPFSPLISTAAMALGQLLWHKKYKLVTAESCTGGGIAYAMTSVPGSSQWFEGGFVTYSNAAKHTQLGVATEIIQQTGAVSAETVSAMASGALTHSLADIAVAVSGIAGPDGGTPQKPVGLVWFAFADKNGCVYTEDVRFEGDRQSVRAQAVLFALQGLQNFLNAVVM